MKTLTKEQVLLLHEKIIDRYGGIQGIRDESLLESALNAPFQSFGGTDLYPSVEEKAVRLGYGLIKNHPCRDGNKRIGALAMLVMLELNDVTLNTTNGDLTDEIMKAAAGELSEEQMLEWVRTSVRDGCQSDQ